MASRRWLTGMLVGSLAFWVLFIGIIVHIHFIEKRDPELEYFAPDIQFEDGGRVYSGLTIDGRKVGYKSEIVVPAAHTLTYWENISLKLNLAGMSREVFIQCVATVDSSRLLSRNMDYTIQSGTHFYNCKSFVTGDSLIVDVQNEVNANWRKGLFRIGDELTYPSALPYYLHRMTADSLSIPVFDPFIFSTYTVDAVRKGRETIRTGEIDFDTTRYSLDMGRRMVEIWLDGGGMPVKSSGPLLFAGALGGMESERATDRDVLLLPIEVRLGADILERLNIVPDRPIENPRQVRFLEVALDGIRAANIDIHASNKRFLDANPVVFGIHYMPLRSKNAFILDSHPVSQDTTIIGTSDYIQSTDARMLRLARQITAGEPDSLEMARDIGRWVYNELEKTPGLGIVRSVDVLRERRGGHEEHTKLFTALTRSIGIPTMIHLGLVYDDGGFRYHSWPSVFTDGAWQDIDPYYGQDRADATHITLIRGGYDRVIELFRVLGQLSIRILDYR